MLTQQGFLSALGRAPKAKGGTGASSLGVDNLPAFLAAGNLKSLISEDLLRSTRAIEFRLPTGGKAFGYQAELLPKVCNIYLRALTDEQREHLAATAELFAQNNRVSTETDPPAVPPPRRH